MKSTERMIDVEVAPTCNFDCPECLVAPRLKASKGFYNPNLVDLLIEHLPKDSQANFIGLGEPTLPRYQRDILKVLERRSDLSGFIQSNGSIPLSEGLSRLVESGRLEVGISYDVHHAEGSLQIVSPNAIQGEYVAGLSMAVTEDTSMNALIASNLLRTFPNMRKVLVEPLHTLKTNEPTVIWEQVINFAYDLQDQMAKKRADVRVFSLVYPHLSYGSNLQYNQKATSNLERIKDEWHIDRQTGIPVLIKDIKDEANRMPRVLINGLVLDETTSAWLSWDYTKAEGNVSIDFSKNAVYSGERKGESDLEFSLISIEKAFQ